MKYNKHEVHLTDEEVEKLTKLRKKSNTSKVVRIRCQVLLDRDPANSEHVKASYGFADYMVKNFREQFNFFASLMRDNGIINHQAVNAAWAS